MLHERMSDRSVPGGCRWAARALAAGLVGGAAFVAAAPAADSTVPTAAAASAAAPGRGDRLRVIEDDRVRIEETLQRGQLRRLVVRSKGSAIAPYEILVAPPGRDPTQDSSGAGQRVWPVLSF